MANRWYGRLIAWLALSIAPAVYGQSITAITDFSETVDGVPVQWERAYYQDTDIAGSSTLEIPFGLTLPDGYSAGSSGEFPLVLYLHGAGARSNWTSSASDPDDRDHSLIDQVMRRSTARFFARSAQAEPAFNAFVLAPQVPSTSRRWVEWSWAAGPYDQTDIPGATYSEYMHLLENLLIFMTDPANDASLSSVLGMNAGDIDRTRMYVVGDSMGAYGTWDILARRSDWFAAGITSGGSGPKNKLDELLQSRIWAIHGALDTTVPNYLPHAGDPDGAGSLGMMGLIDPTFDGETSTPLVYVDDPHIPSDDPEVTDTLIYSEFPEYGHNPPAAGWTDITDGTREWLFAAESAPSCSPMAADQPGTSCGPCVDCSCGTCGDGRVQLCEMIGYACAWKEGCHDDLAGMTRAAFIWKSSECYCWDEGEQNWMPTDCPSSGDACCEP